MTAVFAAAAGLLAAAALVASIRLVRGPSTLDRLVATDMLLAIAAGGVATYAATTRDSAPLAAVLVLTLLGFVSATSVARLLGRDTGRQEQR